MFRFLEDLGDWGFMPLRIALGAVFLYTGYVKFTSMDATAEMLASIGFSLPIVWAWLLAFVEFFGGLFVLIGLLTRIAGFLLAVVMLVAVFMVSVPNAGEFMANVALLQNTTLLAAGLTLMLTGPGRWSIDDWLLWE